MDEEKVNAVMTFSALIMAGMAVFYASGALQIGEPDYSVDCPREVEGYCENISQRYDGNVTFRQKADYTGMNGTAYFVTLASRDEVADSGSSKVEVKFDGDTGRVWHVR